MTKRELLVVGRIFCAVLASAVVAVGCASIGLMSPPVISQGMSQSVPPPVRGRAAARPLAADEELWVITRAPANQANDDDSPGSGAMVATIPVAMIPDSAISDAAGVFSGRTVTVPLPLQHTAVKARIDGYISSVRVQQEFSNPFNQKIEATYLFPLPEKSAVSEFVMIIGERKIRGIIREKEEAQAIYNEARSQGYQASLLVQHRPNVFEQKVANIEPGKSITVDIRYFHTLAYEDGWYTFVFPTVVGPRYNPPGYGDPIVPVGYSSSRSASGTVNASYLRPGERSAHDLSIVVEVNAGVTIEELKSTHDIVAIRTEPNSAAVRLADHTTIPNRDFTLSYKVAGASIRSNLVTTWDDENGQGYFTLMLYPPSDGDRLSRQPMEMVFVLDCSGSMNGLPLQQAKDAVEAALGLMNEGDTFQIIRFSENSTQLGDQPMLATRENVRMARRYLRNLSGTGGTQMIEGIKAALDFPHDPSRLRFVTFMTDGYIGNETDIIAAVHDRIGESRIFSFGVGSSVNRYLLERMAKEGRGAVAYLGSQDSAGKLMRNFFGRISQPALTNIDINWGSMTVSDVYPARIPDLFIGRSLVMTGKYLGAPGDVEVTGISGDQVRKLSLSSDDSSAQVPLLSKIWARLRIADLSDRMAYENDPYGELGNAIKSTALEHQLVSDYTSFVAVDASRVTNGDYGVTVPQAVPVPDGVRYETTIDQQ